MVIIKYYEWVIIEPSLRVCVYRKYNDAAFDRLCKKGDNDSGEKSKEDQGKEIPREEALRLIMENKLKIVHKNIHGTIWG